MQFEVSLAIRENQMSQIDKRIQQLLKKRLDVNEDVPRTSKTSRAIKGDEGYIRQLQQKWTDDIHLLASAVKSLNERLALVDIAFSFVTGPGRPGTTVGFAEFGGRGPKGSGEISFDVFESGRCELTLIESPQISFIS